MEIPYNGVEKYATIYWQHERLTPFYGISKNYSFYCWPNLNSIYILNLNSKTQFLF